MTDADHARLIEEDAFRSFQTRVVPGVEGLHRIIRAAFETILKPGARILIAGAGGGREIETLGASSAKYELVGVDPSSDMLRVAHACVDANNLSQRTRLVEGHVSDLPEGPHFDAATALFVMHFLPDDGAKRDFLRSIRSRLKLSAPYIHVDVCFDDAAMFERLKPVYARHASIGGLAPEIAADVAANVGTMPIVSEAIIHERLAESGFKLVAPIFRGLWYAGWWAEAA